uniref:Uncharacterized protein n=1 Tax=Cucumis sativus TaxID=3659 RepID=A0A0A0L477_CUCSA
MPQNLHLRRPPHTHYPSLRRSIAEPRWKHVGILRPVRLSQSPHKWQLRELHSTCYLVNLILCQLAFASESDEHHRFWVLLIEPLEGRFPWRIGLELCFWRLFWRKKS